MNFKRLINEGIENQVSSEEMEKLVETAIQSRKDMDFQSWSHSVCHLYESYRPENEGILSPKYIQNALKLANKSADFMIDYGKAWCEPRTLGGFVRYNTELMKKRGLNDTPVILPENFRKPDATTLLLSHEGVKNGGNARMLLESKTLREWFSKIQKTGQVCLDITSDEWVNIMNKTPIDKKEQDKIIPSDSDKFDLGIVLDNISKARFAQKKAEGMFVDIDETLVKKYGGLNENLYKLMKDAKQNGENVVIFTSGDISSQIKKLKEAEVDTEMFPVVSKGDYVGCLFTGVIVDDTKPSIQGFGLSGKDVYYKPREFVDCVDEAIKKGKTGNIKDLARQGRAELQLQGIQLQERRNRGGACRI